MLISNSRLTGCPILSLHLGGPIGITNEPIIDPAKLQIIAFTATGPELGNGENGDILDLRSIREYSSAGMIIDSIDEMVNRTDVIKIDKVMSLNFHLIGLPVKTKKGTKLGKITSFTIDANTFTVQQLIVQRPALKSFLDPELIINRSEIVEVNDNAIIIKDEQKTVKKTATEPEFTPNFVNPFRSEPDFAPADNQTPDALDN